MSSLVLTIRESIRYRGGSGHLSWLAHRVSGLAILGFVLLHVWDTANAYFYPALYQWSIDVFKHPIFAMGEIGLVAAVLYHAFNGIRITILDFKPEWWQHQQRSAAIVWVIFLLTFIPVAILMFTVFLQACGERGAACWQFPNPADYIN